MKRTQLLCALIAGTMLGTGAAHAQQAAPAETRPAAQDDDSGAADIIVTAQRRTESVQDVPIAIAVVSGDQLVRQQVVEVRDLQRTTSSLTFGPPGGGSPGGGGIIRGIGTFGFSKGAEAAVGIVVDGVVQGNTNISNLFDIARVEVLRGPQGTLFGQSVSAGVINVTTAAPDPDAGMSGKFSLEIAGKDVAGSEFGRQIVRGAYNVPVSANSALRFSVFANRTDGVTRNTYFNHDDELFEYGGRARFLATLGDKVTINLAGDYARNDQNYGTFFQFRSVQPGTQLAGLLAACGVTAGKRAFTNCGSNKDNVTDTETFGGSGQIDVELGSNTLTSITAYRKQLNYLAVDVDRLPGTSSLDVYSNLNTNFRQFTQELRFASDADRPLAYTVGGFYQKADTNNDQFSFVTIRPVPVFTIRSNSLQIQDTSVKNASVFGEARLKFDPFTVFGGIRFTHSEVGQYAAEQNLTPAPGAVRTNYTLYKDDDVSWRAGAQFAVSPAVMLYGSAARGYKSAQINNQDVDIPSTIVRPEKPMDYQLGIKSNWLRDRLAVNVNLFHTTVKDYQTNRCFPVSAADPGTLTCQPDNVSKVVTKGVEADLFGRPTRNLSLNASAIYNVAEYPDDFFATLGNSPAERSLAGQQIAFAPRWKATFSGEYSVPMGGDVDGFIAADVTYKGKTRMGIGRASADFIYPETVVLGGRIGARVDDAWSLALFARNIGNQPIPTHYDNPAVPLGDPATAAIWQWQTQQSRRLVGIQADFQF